MSNNAKIVTNENVTLVKDGEVRIISKQYAAFQGVLNALKADDFDGAFELADRATQLVRSSEGAFEIRDGQLFRNGLPLHNVIANRAVQFQEQGLSYAPLLRFYERLLSNPSARAVIEAYRFLENRFLPITEDGYFLAYKAVQYNYLSKRSGSTQVRVSGDGGETWRTITGYVPNDIGNILEVDRNQVDDNADNTCSFGLHAGAIEYVESYGNGSTDKHIVVKIDPKDIVSIPTDCEAQKLRACRYEVISDLKRVFTSELVGNRGETVSPTFEDNQIVQNMADEYDEYDREDPCDECGLQYCDGDCVDDFDSNEDDTCILCSATLEGDEEFTCEDCNKEEDKRNAEDSQIDESDPLGLES